MGVGSKVAELVDLAIEKGGRTFSGALRLDEYASQRMAKIVYGSQHQYDQAEAFLGHIRNQAAKVGIKEGSGASNAMWHIFNTVPQEELGSAKPISEVVPAELLGKLTPAQVPYVRIYKKAMDFLADAKGLPANKRLEEYVPWIRDDASRALAGFGSPGYEDVDDYLARITEKRKIPKETFDPHSQKRKMDEPVGVIKDFVKSFDVYSWYGLKKAYKEPAFKEVYDEFQNMEGWRYAEAEQFFNDWLGRKGYKANAALADFLNKGIRQTYKGALFANPTSAVVNLTQTFAVTMPEYGIVNTLNGIARAMTKEGQQEFLQTGIMTDLLHGKRINPVDFFQQVEYVNRMVAYHTGIVAGENAGKAGKDLIDNGFEAVRKTQFFTFGAAETPRAFRRAGVMGPFLQFGQFPLSMSKLLANWANPKNLTNGKLLRFLAITTLIGGPQALMPTDAIFNLLIPKQDRDKYREIFNEWRSNYSLSGIIGVNLAPRLGLGMMPIDTTNPVPMPPIPSTMVNLWKLVFGEGDEPGIWKRLTRDELHVDFKRDILGSKLIQKSAPLFVPGGVAMKRAADVIGIPGLGANTYGEKGEKRNLQGQYLAKETIGQRIKKATLGEPIEVAEKRELQQRYYETAQMKKIGVRDSIKSLLDGVMERDREKTITHWKRLVELGVNDETQLKSLIKSELMRRFIEQQYNFALTQLSKEDRIKYLLELRKLEQGQGE